MEGDFERDRPPTIFFTCLADLANFPNIFLLGWKDFKVQKGEVLSQLQPELHCLTQLNYRRI